MIPVAATATDWIAFLAIAASVVLAGYAVVRLNRRQAAQQLAWREAVGEIPQELRFRPERPWVLFAALVAGVAAAVAGNAVAGTGGTVAGAALGIAPFYAVAARHRRRHRAQVIAAVEQRAGDMSQEELRRLVDGLERSHGRAEMRPLRRLADGD